MKLTWEKKKKTTTQNPTPQLTAIVTAILFYHPWAIGYFATPTQSASYSDAKKK